MFNLRAKMEQTQSLKESLVVQLMKENRELNKLVRELKASIEKLEAKELVPQRCDSPLIYGISEN